MAEPINYPEKAYLILYVEAWGNDYEDFNLGDNIYLDFHDAVAEFQTEAKRRGMTKIDVDYNGFYAVARYDEEHDNYYSGLDKTLTIRARNLIAPQKRRLAGDIYPEFDPAKHTVTIEDMQRKQAEDMFLYTGGFFPSPKAISADCVIWDDPKEVYESIKRALMHTSRLPPDYSIGFPVMDISHADDAANYLTHFPDCNCIRGILAVADPDGHIDYKPCPKCGAHG